MQILLRLKKVDYSAIEKLVLKQPGYKINWYSVLKNFQIWRKGWNVGMILRSGSGILVKKN